MNSFEETLDAKLTTLGYTDFGTYVLARSGWTLTAMAEELDVPLSSFSRYHGRWIVDLDVSTLNAPSEEP